MRIAPLLLLAACGGGLEGTGAPADAPDVPVDEFIDPTGRVTMGLTGLWRFDDQGGPGGNVITDNSMLTPPVTPTIEIVGNVQWLPTSLRVTSPTRIMSTPAKLRLVEAAVAGGGVTLEAWVTAVNDTQTGINGQPTRVISIAPMNASNHYISIDQQTTNWLAAVRTSGTPDVNGAPGLPHPVAIGQSTHLVVTADATARKLYVDGVLVQEDALGGTLPWDPNGRVLSLAGDPNNQNGWVGTFHLIGMYGRALTADEVVRNKNAGP